MAPTPLLQANDLHHLAEVYGLSVDRFALFEGGASNTSYHLQTPEGAFVLTVFNNKPWTDVMLVARLLTLLATHDFPTTRLRRPSTGGLITQHQDRPVMMKPYIAGQVYENLSAPLLHQTGAALARLHQVPALASLPTWHPYGLHCFSRAIAPETCPTYADWLTRQHAYLSAHLPPDLPRSLLHGDLFYDNVLFDAEGFRAIIDFEEACHYARVFDVGMGIVGLCTASTTLALDKARALVQGYQTIQPLEDREKAALQRFVEYAATATSAWRFWKYNLDTPNLAKQETHWQMAALADHVSACPAPRFLEAVFA